MITKRFYRAQTALPARFAVILAIALSAVSCSPMPASTDLGAAVPGESMPGESGDSDEQQTDGYYFFFSYDDSASTAAVELVKYKLERGELPDANLARPWEFLNFEDLSPLATETFDIFSVSFGLWQRPAVDPTDGFQYKLGVSLAAPMIHRTANAVLTLVVDVSGSMDAFAVQTEETTYTRMEIVRRGLLAMLANSLIPGDTLNLITFDDRARVEFSGHLYPADDAAIRDAISALTPDSSTNLDEGIREGYEVAIDTFDPSKTNRVILLTDAWLNTGETDTSVISANTRINNAEGIYFAGLGISADANEAAMNELTEAGKGAYFSILTRRDAELVFTEKFVSLLEVAARDVRFRLDYPAVLTHVASGAEEVSVDPADVVPTNFSYNTSQYFFEGFASEQSLSGSDEFTLTVTYTGPVSLEDRSAVVVRSVSEMLGRDTDLIRDAEAIWLLNQLIAGSMTSEQVSEVLSTFHGGYSSDLFDEYVDLIERYHTLAHPER